MARSLALVCAAVCVAVLLLAVASVPAFALQSHAFSSSFGSTGSGNGQFSGPNGVAVDQSTGDVYVADSANNRVEKFGPTGAFIAAFGAAGSGNGQLSDPTEAAVDNSVSPVVVYVVDSANNRVEKFSAAGAYVSQIDGTSGATPFGQLNGVAVGTTGDVWMYQASGEIDEFDSTGAFLTSFSCSCGTAPGLGVDSHSNVYANLIFHNFLKFSGIGTNLGFVDGSYSDTAIAVAGDDELYIDQGTSIAHYPASCDPSAGGCTPSDTFGASGTGSISQGQGLAVDDATGVVYVADTADNTVKLFTAVTLPDATTGVASGVASSTATVSGTVNPQGLSASYQFQYGTDTSYGSLAPATPVVAGSDSADHVESVGLTGLAPATTYHFRITASNANGSNPGADQTFRTTGPPEVDGASVADLTRTTVTLNAQVNADGLDTSYHFQYGTDTSYGSTLPVPDGDAGSSTDDQPVSVPVPGLQLNTTYHYRVVATNSLGTVDGPDQTFTTQPIAGMSQAGVSDVTATSATLQATLNPLAADSSYHFDYGISNSYGSTVPLPNGGLGAGSSDIPVSQHLTGLAPGTIYHYRVTVANSFGALQSTDHTFTTQPLGSPFKLPDDRGYELVTPPAKGDGNVPPVQPFVIPAHVQAAADGDRLGYINTTSFPGAGQGGDANFLASRGPDGWSSQALDPPQAPTNGLIETPLIDAYSPDLSKAVYLDGGGFNGSLTGQDSPPLVSGEPANNENLFLRDNITNSYQLLNITPSSASPQPASFALATPDLGHVVFESASGLTADAIPGVQNLFEWSDGTVRLVDQIPTAPATTCGDRGVACSAASHGAYLATISGAVGDDISDDGAMVFFAEGTTPYSALYVREHGDKTVEFSASQKTNGSGPGGMDPDGPRPVWFWRASHNGTRVFFSSCEKLTNDATADAAASDGGAPCDPDHASLVGQDLYEYDTASGVLSDLTVDHSGDPYGAQVQAVLGSSADGSYVYFFADGVLAPGARPGACHVFGGLCNLYVRHNGVTTFIARLATTATYSLPISSVTADGTHLAFTSAQSLTGFDTNGFNEVYLYDANEHRLACASCNTTGARPIGSASLPGLEGPNINGFGGLGFPYQQRGLSSDGRRLFFTSTDAVTPGDINGKQDVYEYEDGQPHLISSGTSNVDSSFIDASANGDDVFIETASQLVGQDVDQKFDIYDARVGGGFPFTPAASPCSGEACRPAAVGADADRALGSASFKGSGNPAVVAPAPAKSKAKSLTRAQKLAKALSVCKHRPKRQRTSCRARARKRYGPQMAAKKALAAYGAKRLSTTTGQGVRG
jgi:NHL repeat